LLSAQTAAAPQITIPESFFHYSMKNKITDSRFSLNSRLLVGLTCVLVIGLGVFLATHRARAGAPTTADTSDIPTAGVAKVTLEDLFKEVTIPAEFRSYVEVALHAKVSGYVSKMNVDFGDTVKAG
jgi:multidrug efflux pump subunit AcrA (membrane-fusion protein)